MGGINEGVPPLQRQTHFLAYNFWSIEYFKLEKTQEIANTVTLKMRLNPRDLDQSIESYKQNRQSMENDKLSFFHLLVTLDT